MNMIRHDHIFLNDNVVPQLKTINLLLNNLANREEQSPSPTYLRKNLTAFLCTYGHKIRPSLRIIKSSQTSWLAIAMIRIHSIPL